MAGCSEPSASVTVMVPVEPATTWLLVSTSPSAVRMTPLPSPLPWARFTWMSTVLGAAFAAAAAIEPGAAAAAFDPGADWVSCTPEPEWSSRANVPAPAAPPPTRPAIRAATTMPVRPRGLPGFSSSAVPLAGGGGGK